MRKSVIDRAGHQIDIHRRRALVGNMNIVQAGALIEQFRTDMAAAAGAGRAELQWMAALRQRNELLERSRLHGRMDDEHHRKGGDQRNRLEVGDDVEIHVLEQERQGQEVERRDHHRIAVGRRLRDVARAEEAARTGAIFHDHRLLETGLELVGEQARQRVGRATRRERHDVPDHLGRISVGQGCPRDGRGSQSTYSLQEETSIKHGGSLAVSFIDTVFRKCYPTNSES